jgi:hypothetical protein
MEGSVLSKDKAEVKPLKKMRPSKESWRVFKKNLLQGRQLLFIKISYISETLHLRLFSLLQPISTYVCP